MFDQLKNIHREYGLLHRDVDLASPVGFTDDMIFVVLCEFGRNKMKMIMAKIVIVKMNFLLKNRFLSDCVPCLGRLYAIIFFIIGFFVKKKRV